MLECSLAKPQADQKAVVTNTLNQGLLPSYPPHIGYGLVGNPYGALGAGYGAPGLAQVIRAFLIIYSLIVETRSYSYVVFIVLLVTLNITIQWINDIIVLLHAYLFSIFDTPSRPCYKRIQQNRTDCIISF